jgi:hypothetical protein
MSTFSMSRPWPRLAAAAVFASLLVGLAPSRASAQAAPAPPQASRPLAPLPPGTFNPDNLDAKRLRDQFMTVLKQYPPALGRVLRLDPSLFSNDPFLAPYPLLVAFVNQHPDVKRNPAYFLENVDMSVDGGYHPRSDAMEMWNDLISGVGGLTIFVIVVSSLGWVVRTLVDYRRWNRLSKTQSEAHAKLLDRFTANDELIAYVQSSAGQKFLESAPIALDTGARALAAPFGRILWSVQAGLVAATGGLGLYYVSTRMAADFTAGRVTEDVSQPLYTMGIFALSLGIGFVLSAVASYGLSRRLGLLNGGGPGAPANRRETHAG